MSEQHEPQSPAPEPEAAPAPEPEAAPEPEPETTAAAEPAAEAAAEPLPGTVTPEPTPAAPTPTPPTPAPPAVPPPSAVRPPPTAAAAAVPPPSNPAAWGTVAEDGTVSVRTPDGERPVGSYPGAEPDEALAYFGRKFDELEGQVRLLEQRVVGSGVNFNDAQTAIDHLRESVTDAHAVGDLAGLLARLDELTAAVGQRRARRDAERGKARERAAAEKERIVSEAESLADSQDWKKSGDRMRSLLDEWKAVARLDRKRDDALWKRFSAARTVFDKRRRGHFAELDEHRADSAVAKEKIVKEAEGLAGSKEWKETARAFRDLMTRWKAAGRARRDVEDDLWRRFHAAQDTFFSARSEVFSARDAELGENLEKKRALVAEAERLLPITDLRSARAALRGVHERWEAIGHVPRDSRDDVEGRLRAVDEAVRGSEESAWARSNPEARARAEATIAQLTSSIAALDKAAEDARAAGDEKKAAESVEAAEARRSWLVEAEKTLAEFS